MQFLADLGKARGCSRITAAQQACFKQRSHENPNIWPCDNSLIGIFNTRQEGIIKMQIKYFCRLAEPNIWRAVERIAHVNCLVVQRLWLQTILFVWWASFVQFLGGNLCLPNCIIEQFEGGLTLPIWNTFTQGQGTLRTCPRTRGAPQQSTGAKKIVWEGDKQTKS